MRAWLVAAALFGAAGCGGADGDPLLGSWTFDVSTDEVIGMTFLDDGTYLTQDIFITGGNTAVDEAEKGSYVAAGNAITFTPTSSTCPGPVPRWSAAYSVRSDALQLTPGATTVVFQRAATGGSATNFAVTFGCFAQDGTFTPRQLAPVSN